MKRTISYLASWALYYAGHALSYVMLKFDWHRLYRPYNWIMVKSAQVQDWGGRGPWNEGIQ